MSHTLFLLAKMVRKGAVALRRTRVDAQGLVQSNLVEGAEPSTLAQLAD